MSKGTFTNELEFSRLAKARWRARMRIGAFLNRLIDPVREMELVAGRAYVKRARSPGERLTEEELRSLRSYMADVQDREIRREYFRTTELDRTFQGQVVPMVSFAIGEDESIRSCVDIGAHYAFVDHHLASKHPNVRFTGVDFAQNLAQYNVEFERSNLDFRSGYALELLESGEIDPDLVWFSCTAYEIKNAEIRRYLGILAKRPRTVVFSEPIYPQPGGRIVDPRTVSVEESLAVHSLPTHLPGKYGPLALVHNYRAMAKEAGYTIIHYRAFRPAFTDLRMVHMIAKTRAV